MRWFVPGRIEVLGKHTDYAGGRSLLLASEQGITISAEPLAAGADTVEARSTATADAVTVRAGTPSGLTPGHWGNYLQTVADRLSQNFGELAPARLTIDSTLPMASGISSSSALIVATLLVLADHNDLWNRAEWQLNITDNVDLATYAATIENGADFKALSGSSGVGTCGGSEDHLGIIASVADHITPVSFSPVAVQQPIALPEGWVFAVAVSGVLAEKTGGALEAYNNVSLLARKLVAVWNAATGAECSNLGQVLRQESDAAEHLTTLVETAPDLVAVPRLADRLSDRLAAFVVETEVAIPQAERALHEGDLEAFGRAVDLSHHNAAANLHNQLPETNALQQLAREHGAAAASAFGAGFGGSVWALIPEDGAQRWADAWLARYLKRFPNHTARASAFVTRAAAPARRVE